MAGIPLPQQPPKTDVKHASMVNYIQGKQPCLGCNATDGLLCVYVGHSFTFPLTVHGAQVNFNDIVYNIPDDHGPITSLQELCDFFNEVSPESFEMIDGNLYSSLPSGTTISIMYDPALVFTILPCGTNQEGLFHVTPKQLAIWD